MNDGRLAFILRAPALVERVVRGALREAFRARRYRIGALEVRAFANAALGELDRLALSTRLDVDAIGRLELQNATIRAAGCFASSAVARRLFDLPLERFRAPFPEVDAVVLDAHETVHLVRLELVTSGAARMELGRAIRHAVPATERRPHPPQIHLLSLRDGRLRSLHAPAEDETTERGATPLALGRRRSA